MSSDNHDQQSDRSDQQVNIFRRLYRQYYIPYLNWLGNKLGGRANAGRIGRTSRALRLFGNFLTLSTIIAAIVIIGGATFWTAGAALPLWAGLVVTMGISINFVGLTIGAAGNHLKIEQYYDAELELHSGNNEERLDSEKKEIPHGLKAGARKITMSTVRYTHDTNGLIGTGASWSSSILEAISVFSAGLIIFQPVIASILFTISRVSAFVSATGSVGTNQHRLWVYQKSISEKTEDFYELKKTANVKRHTALFEIVSDTLDNRLNIKQDNKYTSWVKYRCYKALDSAFPKNSAALLNQEQVKNTLVKILIPFVKEEKTVWQKCLSFIGVSSTPATVIRKFDRASLMAIEGEKTKRVSVLDSMPILEDKIYQPLSSVLNEQKYNFVNRVVDNFASYYLVKNDRVISHFVVQLKRAISEKNIPNVNENFIYSTLINNFDYFFTGSRNSEMPLHHLNINHLLEYYPIHGNPHGNQFLPEFHTYKLAQAMAESIERASINIKKGAAISVAPFPQSVAEQNKNTAAPETGFIVDACPPPQKPSQSPFLS